MNKMNNCLPHLLLVDGGLHLGMEDTRGRLEQVRHRSLTGTVVGRLRYATLPEQHLRRGVGLSVISELTLILQLPLSDQICLGSYISGRIGIAPRQHGGTLK